MTESWQRGPLIEFAQLVSTGPFGSMLHKSDYVSDGVPLINPTNIVDESIVPDADKQVGAEARSRLASYALKAGDVVVGRRGEIGRCAVVGINEDGWVCGTGCFFIRPRSTTDSHFLAWLLRSPIYRDQLERASTGATMKNMSNMTLAQLPVALPVFREQQRIVAILDEAFEGIATAKANAERNARNASELYERYVEAAFSDELERGLETTLSEVTGGIFTGPFGSLLHKSDYVQDGIPLINPAHITETGIEHDPRKTVSLSTAQRLAGYRMKDGDIVMGRRGEMGRCALITEVEAGWLCGTGSFIIKSSKHCDPRYLVRFLRSAACKRRLEKIAGGAVMPNLSNTDLGNLTIKLPPVPRQQVIVQEIDAVVAETERLKSLCARKLAALDELKKSLLHQAFSGAL